MREISNAMCRQVWSLPELIRQQYADLEPKTRLLLSTQEIFQIQRIIMTGCGDSYAAGIATKYAFEKLTGIPTEVVPAIELSRYYSEKHLGFSPNNPFVFAVSNSGSVARVGEAIGRVVKNGAFALGITGNRESLLGQKASRVLDLNILPFESAPGTRSYVVSLLSLLLIAIRIGEVRGKYTMDQAMNYRNSIIKLADRLENALPNMDKQAYGLAEQWKDLEAFDFIGSGPEYATAWFGHAKVFEATGKYSMHINTEEWLHLNFFMRHLDRIGTIILTSSQNKAHSRVKELLGYANQLGRPVLTITDAPEMLSLGNANCITTPAADDEIFNPLVQCAPICLVMGYIAEMIGEEDGRGCKGPWSFCEGGAAVKNSEIVII